MLKISSVYNNCNCAIIISTNKLSIKKEILTLKTVGIVAEYNPFHNGHKYQIEQIRKQTGADNIVIVMSGSFVQRGGMAWTDKYLRTQMAIKCGADFVFEIPSVFACASAPNFALGSVALLDSLGFVDEICFGSEEGSLELINKIALILNDENYFDVIDKYLKSGLSFPAAREKFITAMFPDEKDTISKLLKQPNNVLAIEYVKALDSLKSRIKPITIKRIDAGYHSTSLGTNNGSFFSLPPLSSASAIRNAFLPAFENETKNDNCLTMSHQLKQKKLENIYSHLPEAVYKTLSDNPDRFPANNTLLNDMMYYKLLSLKNCGCILDIFSDVSSDLSERIYNKLPEFKDFESFADILKTKQYTHTRITRALTHILLDMKDNDVKNFTSSLYTQKKILYARLLGMKKNKSPLLRNITDIPVITKTADAAHTFEKFSDLLFEKNSFKKTDSTFTDSLNKMFKYDIFASDLYRYCMNNKIPDEYRARIYIS